MRFLLYICRILDILQKAYNTGYLGATVLPTPSDFEVIEINKKVPFYLWKADFFLHKISFAEKIKKSGGYRRGRQSGVAKFVLRRHIPLF